MSAETCECLAQEGALPVDYALEIHRSFGEGRRAGEIRRFDPASFSQNFGANQERISGEGGKELIRRFPVSYWTQRENLPDALTGGSQPIGEAAGLGTEIADAIASG